MIFIHKGGIIIKRLFVDMDGTLATWRSAASYEDLFQKGYFRHLPPYQAVVEAVEKLVRAGIQTYILSAYLEESPYAAPEKIEWAKEFAPFIRPNDRLLVPTGIKKADFVEQCVLEGERLNADCFLLDDYSANLHEWKEAGGTGIKLINGVNGNNGTWKDSTVSRFESAEKIAKQISYIMEEHK